MDIFVFPPCPVTLGVVPMFVSLGAVRTYSSAAIARFTCMFTLLPFLPTLLLPVTYDPACVTSIAVRWALSRLMSYPAVAAFAVMSAYSVNFFNKRFNKIAIQGTPQMAVD